MSGTNELHPISNQINQWIQGKLPEVWTPSCISHNYSQEIGFTALVSFTRVG